MRDEDEVGARLKEGDIKRGLAHWTGVRAAGDQHPIGGRYRLVHVAVVFSPWNIHSSRIQPSHCSPRLRSLHLKEVPGSGRAIVQQAHQEYARDRGLSLTDQRSATYMYSAL